MPYKQNITMTRKELSQTTVFTDLKHQRIRQKEAAKKLNLSVRQVQRKLKRYLKQGALGLAHRGRGQRGNRSLPKALKNKAISLMKKYYPDFGPTLACEKLWENHALKINKETLRLTLIEKGLWRNGHGALTVHVWRERRDCRGELVQLDGSPHDWFEGRAPKCTLLAFIDDASSELLWLEFAHEETTVALMRATETYLQEAGRPLSFYTDRGKVFKVNIHNEENDRFTQYQRALSELDIELIHARSPQAKGRVERLFGTLQDRLVKELRLKKISDMVTANTFLRDVYRQKHNQKFTVTPKQGADLHRSLQGYDLKRIFCLKEERKVRNDFTVQYKKQWLQLDPKQMVMLTPQTVITVEESLSGELLLSLRGKALKHTIITDEQRAKRKEEKNQLIQPKPQRVPWIPPANHPWRQRQKATFLNC